MAKQKIDVKQTFEKFASLSEKARTLQKELDQIEKEKEVYKLLLMQGIPPNEVKDGIRHKRTVSRSVSYAKAMDAIREKLVPKTKHDALDMILQDFTKETFRDSFEAAE
jgi:hypothetical protein